MLGLSWQHLRGIPRSCGHSSGWEQPRSSPRVPRAAPGGDSGTSTTTQPCQERSHAGWGRTPCPGADPHSLLLLFHPSAGGKLEDRTRQLLQSMAAPIIPSWLTQKWFPSRLSPCRDSSVVSPPHVQHTGRPGRGSAARKSLAQGSYLLMHGCPTCQAGHTPQPLELALQDHVPCSSKPKEKPHHFPRHLPARGACSTGRLGTRKSSQMPAHPVPLGPALDADLAGTRWAQHR